MQSWIRQSVAVTAVLAFTMVGVLWAADASAEKKTKSVRSEVEWIAYDEAASEVKVKVKKPGKGAKGLKKGKEAVFKVKAEGSVLTKTVVKVNGRAGELTDIPAGKTVNVYWKPDPANKDSRKASSIDVIFSEEELNRRYNIEDAE